MRQRNEEEIHALRRENEEMRERRTKNPTTSNQTKNIVVNEIEQEESRPQTSTHISSQTEGNRRHPFTDKIMNIELSSNWKGLSMDWYDRMIDPDVHVDIYVTQINLYTGNNAVFCRVFPTSLKGATLSWFTHLPPYSVDKFESLVSKFSSWFATSRPHHVTSITLINIDSRKVNP